MCMKKKLLLLLLIPFLSACLSTPSNENPINDGGNGGITNPDNNNNDSGDTHSEDDGKTEENNDGGENSENENTNNDNGDNNNNSSENGDDNTSEEDDNGSTEDDNNNSSTENNDNNSNIKTIKEVREMCEQYVTNLNASKIGVDMEHKVTIRAFAAQKFDLVKTKSSFGLDKSAPAKVLFFDESGYICAASNGGSSGNTLFGKVGDYAGKDGSYYEVSGYLSIYLGKPEIYVPETFGIDINNYIE